MKKRILKTFLCVVIILIFVISITYHTLPDQFKNYEVGTNELSYVEPLTDNTLITYEKLSSLLYITDNYKVFYCYKQKHNNKIFVTPDKFGASLSSYNIIFYSNHTIKIYSYDMNKKKHIYIMNNSIWKNGIYIFTTEYWENRYQKQFDIVTLYIRYENWDKKEYVHL